MKAIYGWFGLYVSTPIQEIPQSPGNNCFPADGLGLTPSTCLEILMVVPYTDATQIHPMDSLGSSSSTEANLVVNYQMGTLNPTAPLTHVRKRQLCLYQAKVRLGQAQYFYCGGCKVLCWWKDYCQ